MPPVLQIYKATWPMKFQSTQSARPKYSTRHQTITSSNWTSGPWTLNGVDIKLRYLPFTVTSTHCSPSHQNTEQQIPRSKSGSRQHGIHSARHSCDYLLSTEWGLGLDLSYWIDRTIKNLPELCLLLRWRKSANGSLNFRM